MRVTFSSAAAKAEKEIELARQTPAEFDAMFSTIWEMFNSGENWQLYPETVEVVKVR